jgi:death on curing protein
VVEHQWPSIGEVLAIHDGVARSAQQEPKLRDMAVLEACLFRAEVGAYGSVTTAGSALFESIVLSQPFEVLNRATGFAVLDVFLRLNGLRLTCTEDDVLRAVLAQPGEGLTWQQVESWLAINTRSI